jgi:hypothetical protein
MSIIMRLVESCVLGVEQNENYRSLMVDVESEVNEILASRAALSSGVTATVGPRIPRIE